MGTGAEEHEDTLSERMQVFARSSSSVLTLLRWSTRLVCASVSFLSLLPPLPQAPPLPAAAELQADVQALVARVKAMKEEKKALDDHLASGGDEE